MDSFIWERFKDIFLDSFKIDNMAGEHLYFLISQIPHNHTVGTSDLEFPENNISQACAGIQMTLLKVRGVLLQTRACPEICAPYPCVMFLMN